MTADERLHRQVSDRLHRVDQLYTRSRRTIVEALYDCGTPLTLPELLQQAPTLTQSSAYRNLAMMEQAGVVRRLVRSEHARYELAEDLTGHHHHVICTSCGMIRDFTLEPRLERSLNLAFSAAARHAGLQPRHHDIDIYGTCADCSAEPG
jgi:Fur family transcriptional regulator, ferric uptake regulator